MGLCLFANNHVIDHEETRMIDQNKKPTKEERLSKRKVLAGTV